VGSSPTSGTSAPSRTPPLARVPMGRETASPQAQSPTPPPFESWNREWRPGQLHATPRGPPGCWRPGETQNSGEREREREMEREGERARERRVGRTDRGRALLGGTPDFGASGGGQGPAISPTHLRRESTQISIGCGPFLFPPGTPTHTFALTRLLRVNQIFSLTLSQLSYRGCVAMCPAYYGGRGVVHLSYSHLGLAPSAKA
jgi:hypothetical protein